MPGKTVFLLNAHLFAGTIVGTFYRKLLYDDAARRNQICQYLRETRPDVVFISEVWSGSWKRRIAKDLVDVYPHSRIPSWKDGPWWKLGPEHLVLSKEPITDFESASLTTIEGKWDKWSLKQIVGLRTGGVYFCTSHFDTHHPTANVDQMVSFVDARTLDPNEPVMALGDFNIDESSSPEEHGQMVSSFGLAGLHDAVRMVYPDATVRPEFTQDSGINPVAAYFCGNSEHRVRIDYAFTKNMAVSSVRVVSDRNLSDHFGLFLEYDM